MAAELCDFMVCNEDATYGYTDAPTHFYPTTREAMLLSERLGAAQAQDLLYVTTAATGKELRAKGWTCPIVPEEQIEAYAQKLAATLATKSQRALRLLKQHLTRDLAGLVKELTCVEVAAPARENPSDQIAEETSPAEHIHLNTPAENVVVIKFGVTNKQALVGELVTDLGHVLAKIHQNGCCKAIVLSSEYPGFLPGTEPALAEDVVLEFQRLVLESEIPVVAALGGNAKGYAWLMSQFCDACVYSQTGVYGAATLGQSRALATAAAATFIYRLGKTAGQAILLTGADYSGAELEQRIGALTVDRIAWPAVLPNLY